jgi:hypothetical protein
MVMTTPRHNRSTFHGGETLLLAVDQIALGKTAAPVAISGELSRRESLPAVLNKAHAVHCSSRNEPVPAAHNVFSRYERNRRGHQARYSGWDEAPTLIIMPAALQPRAKSAPSQRLRRHTGLAG